MRVPRTRPTRPGRIAIASLAVVAALSVGACSAPDEDTAASASMPAADPGALPVTIDHEYGATTVSAQPSRVAAMGVGDADTLLALGSTPTTIAPFADPTQRSAPWNADLLGDAEPVILPQAAAQFGSQIPLALQTEPDLVTAVGAAPTREQYDILSKAAPTVVRPADHPAWQVPWDVQTTQIGRAVGLPEQAQAKIDETESFLADIREQHPEFAGKTGVVVTAAPDGGLSIYSADDGRGQALADYGLSFPESLQPAITNGFYGSISAENMSMLNDVDVVVAVDWDGANDRLRNDPAWSRLPVVTEGRVVYLDQQVGSAMSVPTVLTIPWVAAQAVEPISAAAQR